MSRMKPCWSCGATDRPCSWPCECAKCVDPHGYAEWKSDQPAAYAHWMADNLEDEHEAEQWRWRAEEMW